MNMFFFNCEISSDYGWHRLNETKRELSRIWDDILARIGKIKHSNSNPSGKVPTRTQTSQINHTVMTQSRYEILFEPVQIGPVTAKNRFYQDHRQ